MSLKLSTAPTAEPLELAAAKAQLRLDGSDEDSFVSQLISIARRYVEEITWRSLINQTWVLKRDTGFPARFVLPRPPLSSVTSITYIDTAGASQTLSSGDYVVDTNSDPGRVYPAWSVIWPATRGQRDAVTVTYVGGYGATAETVPEPLRQAIALLVGHWFRHREAVQGSRSVVVPMAVESLVAPYIVRDHRVLEHL